MKTLIEDLRTRSADLRNEVGECEITLMLDKAADAINQTTKITLGDLVNAACSWSVSQYTAGTSNWAAAMLAELERTDAIKETNP